MKKTSPALISKRTQLIAAAMSIIRVEFIDKNGSGPGVRLQAVARGWCLARAHTAALSGELITTATSRGAVIASPARPSAVNSCSRLGSKRINDFQKRELMKICIAGTDLPNAMLAHENCRMRIMQQITGKMR
jgi:hypothetical protein